MLKETLALDQAAHEHYEAKATREQLIEERREMLKVFDRIRRQGMFDAQDESRRICALQDTNASLRAEITSLRWQVDEADRNIRFARKLLSKTARRRYDARQRLLRKQRA